jgi:transposase
MAQEGLSKRQVCREEGISWQTLEKILAHTEPPGYRRSTPDPAPKLGPFVERIEEILAGDKTLPKKQRHTAQRIFERLQEEGYEGGYTQVREKVAQLRRVTGEVFIPLRHDPGTAQVDVVEALVNLRGKLLMLFFLVMVLR